MGEPGTERRAGESRAEEQGRSFGKSSSFRKRCIDPFRELNRSWQVRRLRKIEEEVRREVERNRKKVLSQR